MDTKFAVIVQNDESQWNDDTGIQYHFPKRYLKYISEGTKIIYYKGKQKSVEYKNKRLSAKPHYFGYATIGTIISDGAQPRNCYASIIDYIPFESPVLIRKPNGQEYEKIPSTRITNYWRDGVRPITVEIYRDILSAVDIYEENLPSLINVRPFVEGKMIDKTNSLLRTRKRKVLDKINSSSIVHQFYSPKAKEIGNRGEQIVVDFLMKTLSAKESQTLRWLANENITPGYDIEYESIEGIKICIEVKSTTAKAFTQFLFTINELQAAKQHNENYIIFLVSDCLGEAPMIDRIMNPFLQQEKGNLIFEPITFRVFREEE